MRLTNEPTIYKVLIPDQKDSHLHFVFNQFNSKPKFEVNGISSSYLSIF